MTEGSDEIRAGYDGVVYDLDGTLVHLAVDWSAAAQDVWDVYQEAGLEPGTRELWDMLVEADDHGLAREVEETVAAHEHDGARESRRLPTADELLVLDRPVGVCSLNCERACEIALEIHGLASHVDAVVGRDSVSTHKPDPQPLLATVEALDRSPDRVVFVGDSERDAITADRAGVDFEYVDGAAPE